MAIKTPAGTMVYTYTKHYALQRDPHRPITDFEWLRSHFGPTSYDLLSDPCWTRHILGGIGDSLTVEYTFKDSEDYALFVLSCGDQ